MVLAAVVGGGHPHVPADADEHRHVEGVDDAERHEVGGEGLAGGAEVERGATGHGHGGLGDDHLRPRAAPHRECGR